MSRCLAALGAMCAVMLIVARFVFAADAELQLRPRALRPGDTVTVKPAATVDSKAKLFLRLDGPQLRDVPVGADQLGGGLLRVELPKDLRQGRYGVELVDDKGDNIGKPASLKVLATVKPVITKLTPEPSYAEDGTYSFEVVGENFGDQADDSVVRINGIPVSFAAHSTDRARTQSLADCGGKFPCLIGARTHLHVYRLSLQGQAFYRPMSLTVQVDSQESQEKPLLLSWVQRRTPALVAFLALGILCVIVFRVARPKAEEYQPFERRYATFAYLFIEPETNTYSLSRFQLILWTVAAVVTYVYLAASQSLVQWKWQLPEVPEGLPSLLGLSVGTTALAIGATATRGSKGAGPAHPGLGDFITTGGTLAPERLQFFIWTLIGVFGFVSATLAQDPATLQQLPKIPDSFLPLMGVSAAGYLAGKVVRKPGPVIKQVVPPPPYAAASPPKDGIRIVGENLSPRALVWIGGMSIDTNAVSTVAPESSGMEFVTQLSIAPQAALSAVAGVAAPAGGAPTAADAAAQAPAKPGTRVVSIKVVNPDGQGAEL